MKILKFILVLAVVLFQVDFAQASRNASYYKAAKYFKASPKKAKRVVKKAPKKAGKALKSAKFKKKVKGRRSIASVSGPKKLKLKKFKSAKLPAKKKRLR